MAVRGSGGCSVGRGVMPEGHPQKPSAREKRKGQSLNHVQAMHTLHGAGGGSRVWQQRYAACCRWCGCVCLFAPRDFVDVARVQTAHVHCEDRSPHRQDQARRIEFCRESLRRGHGAERGLCKHGKSGELCFKFPQNCMVGPSKTNKQRQNPLEPQWESEARGAGHVDRERKRSAHPHNRLCDPSSPAVECEINDRNHTTCSEKEVKVNPPCTLFS